MWRIIQHKPISLKRLAGFDEILKIDRLDQERIGAQLVGLVDIADLVRGSEDYNAKVAEGRVLTNPSQHLESIHARHLQIEQYQFREWVFRAVAEFAFACEIKDGLFAVAYDFEAAIHTGTFKCLAHEEDVVFAILS